MSNDTRFRTRRGFIAMGGGAAAALTACVDKGPKTKVADNSELRERKLTMVTTWPKGLAGLHTTSQRIADSVQKLSGGKITINVYAAGELAPPLEAFDTVADGTADMSHCASGYWTSKSRAFPLFTTVPMGMTTSEMLAWLKFGDGQALWDRLTKPFGVKSLPAGTTGHQMGGFFRKPVNNLKDFVGLKYRIAGLGADLVRAMGGSAVTIPGGEVFQALQSGLIDATEFVGPWNDRALGFGRVAPYYYGPGFHEPGSIMSLDVNGKLWDSLNETEKFIFEAACSDACTYSMAQYQHFNATTLAEMVEAEEVEIRQFPSDIWEAARRALPAVLKNVSNTGSLEAEIVKSYSSHLKLYSSWTSTGDGGFILSRN